MIDEECAGGGFVESIVDGMNVFKDTAKTTNG